MKRNFEAAIFDLDGTLLDSMYVWARVDQLFFERRGMTAPEDYGPKLAGLSYRESAEYTISRFGFPESWQEIVAEWTGLARAEYAGHVPLKPGAREYLCALRQAGVRLAVATALPEYLYRPCLERNGVYEWFDTLCSTDDTGGRGKASGEVFLLAAHRLGVAPAACAVFEDVLEGVRGAKRAGMRAYCIRDEANAHAHAEIAGVADGMLDSWNDMPRPSVDAARRCVIFTAHCEGDLHAAYANPRADDLLLCADAGWKLAEAAGFVPDCVIGDFDSGEAPEGRKLIRHPVVKDDSDTMLCVKYALEKGFGEILIAGGLGGRLDHTLANLQTLAYIAQRGARAELCDGNTRVYAVHNGTLSLPCTPGKLSVLAMGGDAEDVCIRGAKYTMEHGRLTCSFPLGMGNDFASDRALVSVGSGTLLVIAELKGGK